MIREPWMTVGLLKSSSTLDKLFRRSSGRPTGHPTQIKHKQYINMFNHLKRNMKQNYYRDLLNKYKTDIRKTWSIMKTIISKNNDKSNICYTFNIENTDVMDPSEIANSFCDYFTKIGKQLSDNIPTPKFKFNEYMKQNPLNITNSIFFSPTDTQEISKLITSLKAKKSSGHDALSSWLLKTLSAEITEPLCYLVNKSLEEGIMPYELKIAKVIPIFKAKERNQLKKLQTHITVVFNIQNI